MSISRSKRIRRAALAEMRRQKCTKHRVPACDDRNCRRDIAVVFYGIHKKATKRSKTTSVDLDRLFYLIRNPHEARNYFRSLEDEAATPVAVSVPVSPPQPPPVAKLVANTRQLSIRERIALGVPASA